MIVTKFEAGGAERKRENCNEIPFFFFSIVFFFVNSEKSSFFLGTTKNGCVFPKRKTKNEISSTYAVIKRIEYLVLTNLVSRELKKKKKKKILDVAL